MQNNQPFDFQREIDELNRWKELQNQVGLQTKLDSIGKWGDVLTKDGVMSADKAMAKAGFVCDSSPMLSASLNSNPINQINTLALDNFFLGWGELSLLQQNKLLESICSLFADSMTSKWIEFRSNKGNKSKRIKELEVEFERLKVREVIRDCIYKTMLLGTGYIAPKIADDEDDLNSQLYPASWKVPKGSLQYLKTIEPTWVVPIEFNMDQPRKLNFYEPQKYNVFGETIDRTRMMKMMYIKPVNLLSPQYLFGGIPLVQTILPYVLDFLNTKREIVNIVSRINTSILKTNPNALHGMSDYGKTMSNAGGVKRRAEQFVATRNNFGLFLLANDEEFEQIQIQLNGLVDVLQQQAELICLFIQTPVTKIFGQAPRGMNATGEYDEKNWIEKISNLQSTMVRPVLQNIFELAMINIWGKIDDSIIFEFIKLGESDPEQESKIKDGEVNRIVSLVQSTIISAQEARKHLAECEDLDFNELEMEQGAIYSPPNKEEESIELEYDPTTQQQLDIEATNEN